MSDNHPDSPPKGGDIHPDRAVEDQAPKIDHPERVVQSEDERHEEALEESFPASDPPSAKHIT